MRALTPLYHLLTSRWRKPTIDEEHTGPLWHYPYKHFVRVADIFCVFAAALVPSASVISLYYVNDMLTRLLLIIVFSFLFAGAVLMCFGCGMANTFAATVAFMAVQVVFVQGVGGIKT